MISTSFKGWSFQSNAESYCPGVGGVPSAQHPSLVCDVGLSLLLGGKAQVPGSPRKGMKLLWLVLPTLSPSGPLFAEGLSHPGLNGVLLQG